MNMKAIWKIFVTMYVSQELCVWEWTVESEEPLCRTTISTDYGHQRILTFHPSDSSQLVSNSDDTVVFYHWVSPLSAKFNDFLSFLSLSFCADSEWLEAFCSFYHCV